MNKTFYSVGVSIATAASAMLGFAQSPAAQEFQVKLSVSQGIQNMRTGPGVEHTIVVAIPAGSRGLVQVGECVRPDDGVSQFAWCRFNWGRYTGWVSQGGLEAVRGNVSAQAESSKYPIVFQTGNELKSLGIALDGWGKPAEVRHFPNRCYYYGDGGYSMSVSDGLLEKYRQRGFSLNSLCMGLQSPLAFDPETGKRLPSYMVADSDAVRRKQIVAGTISDVLPLRVPDCYKRGMPYHDCQFKYDIKTGRRLSSSKLEAIEKAKRVFDEKMAEIRRNGAYAVECSCAKSSLQPEFSTTKQCRLEKIPRCQGGGSESLIVGTLRPEGYFVSNVFGGSDISLIDISPSLPLGYGYALMTAGDAAPDGGDPATAADSSRRSSDAKLSAAASDM